MDRVKEISFLVDARNMDRLDMNLELRSPSPAPDQLKQQDNMTKYVYVRL